MPIIIRVDGRAFHTYTRPLKDRFNEFVTAAMNLSAFTLFKEIQGAQLAYVQSDEISLLVHGYKRFNSESWYDNQLQKMVSVAAGIASATFTSQSQYIFNECKPAVFDARAFIVPEADVCNYFLWRQQDAVRNSVQMLARSLRSHKECTGLNVGDLKEMCKDANSPWEELPTRLQRGLCVKRDKTGTICYDHCIPLFNEDRDYVNNLLNLEEA